MENIEHKLGEVVTFPDGLRAEVVEGLDCVDCVLYKNYKMCQKHNCDEAFRSDRKTILYQEIKNL